MILQNLMDKIINSIMDGIHISITRNNFNSADLGKHLVLALGFHGSSGYM